MVGYSESIKAANRRHRKRRERMSPLRRAIVDAASATALTIAAAALWAAMLAPLIAYVLR